MATQIPSGTSSGSDTSRHFSEAAEDLKGNARQAYKDVKDSVSEVARRGWDASREMTRDGIHKMEERVQDKPIASLAIAAALGFIFGMMTRRHRY